MSISAPTLGTVPSTTAGRLGPAGAVARPDAVDERPERRPGRQVPLDTTEVGSADTARQAALAQLGHGIDVTSAAHAAVDSALTTLTALRAGDGSTEELLEAATTLHHLTLSTLPAGAHPSTAVTLSLLSRLDDGAASVDALRGGINLSAVSLLAPTGSQVTDTDIDRGIATVEAVSERIDSIRANLLQRASVLSDGIVDGEDATATLARVGDLAAAAPGALMDAHAGANAAATWQLLRD